MEQDSQYDKAEADIEAAIQLPEGLDEEFILSRSAHLNRKFDEWFAPKYLRNIKDTLRILEGKSPDGSLTNGTMLPLAASILQTAQARLSSAIMARSRYVEAVCDEAAEPEQEAYEQWMNQAIANSPRFAEEFAIGLRNGLQEGTSVWEVSWRKHEERVRVLGRDPFSGEMMESERINTRSGAELEAASLFELAWDPREKRGFSTASWVRRRRIVSAAELFRLQAEGIIERASYAVETSPREKGEWGNLLPGKKDPDEERSRAVMGQPLPVLNYEDGVFQLDEFWATMTWKDAKGEWKTDTFNYWIVGGSCLVKFRLSPFGEFKPFITGHLLPRSEGLVGMTMVDMVKDALREEATNMSRYNRVLTRIAETPTLVGIGSGLNVKSKLLQENAVLPVFDVNQVKMAPVPGDVLMALDRRIQFLIAEIRQGTPANDQSQGLQQQGVDTATEASILAKGSSSRFEWMAMTLCSSMFPCLADFIRWCYLELWDKEAVDYRLGGINGKPASIPMDVLAKAWRHVPYEPVEEGQRQQRFQLLKGLVTELAMASAKMPEMFVSKNGNPVKVNMLEFLREEMLPLLGVDGDKLFLEGGMEKAGSGPGTALTAGSSDPQASGAGVPGDGMLDVAGASQGAVAGFDPLAGVLP